MRPLVVGIAGGTASGKSTVAERVVEALGSRCLHLMHDRYYKPLPDALRGRPHEHNFDHPDALDTPLLVEHVSDLLAGRSVELPCYDFATQRRVNRERVEPRPVLVVEGILVLADEGLRSRMDHKVYVTTPADIRLLRRIRRDMAERGRSVSSILAQYEATVRPMHQTFVAPSRDHADLLLDGTAAIGGLVEQVLALPGVRSPGALG